MGNGEGLAKSGGIRQRKHHHRLRHTLQPAGQPVTENRHTLPSAMLWLSNGMLLHTWCAANRLAGRQAGIGGSVAAHGGYAVLRCPPVRPRRAPLAHGARGG